MLRTPGMHHMQPQPEAATASHFIPKAGHVVDDLTRLRAFFFRHPGIKRCSTDTARPVSAPPPALPPESAPTPPPETAV